MLVDKACVAGEDMAECESIQVPDGKLAGGHGMLWSNLCQEHRGIIFLMAVQVGAKIPELWLNCFRNNHEDFTNLF